MKDTIYAIVDYDYDGVSIHSYFIDKEKAEKYVAVHSNYTVEAITLNTSASVDYTKTLYTQWCLPIQIWNLKIITKYITVEKKYLGETAPEDTINWEYITPFLLVVTETKEEAIEKAYQLLEEYKQKTHWVEPTTEDVIGMF